MRQAKKEQGVEVQVRTSPLTLVLEHVSVGPLSSHSLSSSKRISSTPPSVRLSLPPVLFRCL